MQYLYAPWREAYSLSPEQKNHSENSVCIFCMLKEQNPSPKNLIVKRYTHNYLMLNAYPYNAGHLLIVPYTHTDILSHIAPDAQHEIMNIMTESTEILRKVINAQGFNIGVNLGGKVAGGSIADPLHFHIVPRWMGDTNFMIPIADTKPISHNLETVYTR